MKKNIGCILFVLCGINLCSAQQVVSIAGGEATGAEGTVSYTIGQVIYSYITGIEGSVSQGVQQPYEIMVISSIEDKYGTNLEISVNPNPTSAYVKLKIENYKTDNLTYQLYDMNGKLLENKKIDGTESNIRLDMLAPSVYYLKVSGSNKKFKIFKIIKN